MFLLVMVRCLIETFLFNLRIIKKTNIMTTLERNNLDAQVQLMKDIIKNDYHIFYGVINRGKELIEILQNSKYVSSDKSYTLTEEDFKKLTRVAYILGDENNHKNLGILAETAVPENKMKKEVLALLQKS